jgi:hypothetical protein
VRDRYIWPIALNHLRCAQRRMAEVFLETFSLSQVKLQKNPPQDSTNNRESRKTEWEKRQVASCLCLLKSGAIWVKTTSRCGLPQSYSFFYTPRTPSLYLTLGDYSMNPVSRGNTAPRSFTRGWILGRNWDKSFPPCYSQSPLTDFTPHPLTKVVLHWFVM